MTAEFVIGHLEIVTVFNFHFRWENCSGGKRWERNGYDLMSPLNENFCCFGTEKTGAANHKNFHV